MRSTFMGLEASKKGLFVQQSALYTTGHNISNANTLGYSRQRVNMEATPGYPHPGLNSPTYPGHLGTGVEATNVQRIRDEFIDRQYRQETNKHGYWDSTLKSINQMEDILREPSEFGINQSFTDFWKSLQDVAANPTDTAARKVAISKGEALAESFNYNYTQLETIQGNLGNEIDVTTKDINSLLKKIAAVNEQIITMEPNGYVMNDLYDARDVLIDELNEYLPVSIERVPSGGNASEVAEGSLTVTFKTADGTPITLVEGKDYATIAVNGTEDTAIDGNVDNVFDQAYDPFKEMIVTNWDGTEDSVEYADFEVSRGKLLGLIDAYGYEGEFDTEGIYPEMLARLDILARNFVEVFNQVHNEGNSLPNAALQDFFEGDSAKSIKVIIDDPNAIAASSGLDEEGNGKWATELANLQHKSIGTTPVEITVDGTTVEIEGELDGATFQGYYTSMIGDLAVKGQEAIRLEYNSGTLLLTTENNRASMSSVSLDEEMTNMITFQQAYNANARMLTVVDETLDKIINGMGRVGL